MACKADEIRRNWEYGWSEPDQNWIWPITTKRFREGGVMMQDGFRRGNTTIRDMTLLAIRHLEPGSEHVILVSKTDEGIELTQSEFVEFKMKCEEFDLPWIVVNEKHIITNTSFCRNIGKHIDELYPESSSQRGGSPGE